MNTRKIKLRGEARWLVDGFIGDRRVRRYCSSRQEADHKLTQLLALKGKDDQVAGDWLDMPSEELQGMMRLYQEMRRTGVTPQGVIELLSKKPEMAKQVTLADAVARCIESKRTAGCREKYIAGGLSQVLRQFMHGRELQSIATVQVGDIEDFVSRGKTAMSRCTYLNRVNTLFSFALRRQWITRNPCTQIDRPKVELGPPSILTVRQAARALVWTRRRQPRFLAWLALGLFAGVRPEEIDRLEWKNVDLSAGLLTIDAAAAKVRARRYVHLEPAAIAWLKVAHRQGAELRIPHSSRRRYQRQLGRWLGFSAWPKDILRHSAASYLVAVKKDVAAIAMELGNSPNVLLRHYRDLVRPTEAERFLALIPRSERKAHAQSTLS